MAFILDIVRTAGLVAFDLLKPVVLWYATFCTDKMIGDNIVYRAPSAWDDGSAPRFTQPWVRPVIVSAVAIIQWAMAVLTCLVSGVMLSVFIWLLVPIMAQFLIGTVLIVVEGGAFYAMVIRQNVTERWKQVRENNQ